LDDEVVIDPITGPGEAVSFGARAYPLLEMLRAAHREHEFVMWGV
jgi:hypothetical protein